jgi:aquaporin Z
MKSVREAAVAEFLGTFALCFIGAGVVCVYQWSGGAVGLLGIAIAHGTVLAVMISALGHLSGGHFNPAVTLGVLTANKIDVRRAIVYLLAQLAGAIAAAYLLKGIIPAQAWQPVHLGAPSLGPGVTVVQAVVVEAVLTFFLVLTVCGTALDPRGSWSAVAGFGIGTVLVFDILMGGLITGGAMNPARAFGPALASGYWDHHLVYWLGPLTGGVLAAFLYSTVFLKK